MKMELIPLMPELEKKLKAPGKYELVRVLLGRVEHARREGEKPPYVFTDSYGRFWARPKDVDAIAELVESCFRSRSV